MTDACDRRPAAAPAQWRCLFAHLAAAAVLITLYGRHVCGYAGALSLVSWLSVLLPVLAVVTALRALCVGWALRDPGRASARLFALDWGVFASGGLLFWPATLMGLSLPPGSLFKIATGFVLYGFFVGAETSLGVMRARLAGAEAAGFDPRQGFRPIWQRIMGAAVLVIGGLGLVVTLLALRLMEHVEAEGADPRALSLAITAELLVAVAVFMVLAIRLSRLAGGLTSAALGEQVAALRAVGAGDLAATARAGTADEIGLVSVELNALVRRLAERTAALAAAEAATVRALVSLASARDDDTGRHLDRTQAYVRLLAEALGQQGKLASGAVETIVTVAPLHDIGKVGIPDSILNKPGRLTEDEMAVMREHVRLGEAAIARAAAEAGAMPLLVVAERLIAGHHEKWDGTGYPRGLAAEEIPLEGRIMAVADVYDALRSRRVYKPAMGRDEAARIILDGAGRHFDPALVRLFAALEPAFDRIATTMADAAPAAAPAGESATAETPAPPRAAA